MRFSDLEGRRVAVWGLGLEGRAALAALSARGIEATVAESDADADVLRAAEVVVKSPGVPVSSPLYAELATAGVAFTSNTDLWLSENADRAIGVTGTKGKSTTSSAIAHLLGALGEEVSLGGNIGVSLLDAAATGTVVMEVSSYQAQSISVSPRVAVVTSLFPEHLPWHGSEERYFSDKLRLVSQGASLVVAPGHDRALVGRIIAALPEGATLHLTHLPSQGVLAAGDAALAVRTDPGRAIGAREQSGLIWDGVGAIAPGDLPLVGVHNAHNLALAVLAVAVALDITSGDPRAVQLLDAVRTFAPLAHRMETVPSRDGRRWIDDSLATAPEAVIAALSVFPDEPVALILGGADRGLDLSPLAAYLRGRHSPVHLLLIGPAGARFGREHAIDLPHAAIEFTRMADAVAWGLSVANPANVVLLSPGAPSFDEYRDYADRARHLCELIAP
ncbi:UDP-N-acetylmuramoyl-L-alanine--D-glutamate ligase [Nocardioides jiangxiensis]|uniref:UDP-N-acetylmuramoylalanine--D-glutamate ligase n=1 Tax=Nocardioides jiangxiensis TaxID=3064524 RepID=A0ABT9B385_9ACTN|nr:UDP-N-acetylmuramoyl-L-alanine--D-glutamate ligase [Nocardioides sp. WY-20]MDO7869315.1 UDP-N-acetylmuramoyl-L-alanine--D-glutamate ligase [Nocardioides sp. WY-20]